MSNIKCPLCGGDLIQSKEFPYFYSCQSTNWKSDADKLCELDDCAAPVPVWETLRRTRKALDVAKDTFNWIDETYQTGQEMETEIWGKVQLAAQEITALEQITALNKIKDKEQQ